MLVVVLVLLLNMGCWSLAEQILAVLAPSKNTPGSEGAAVGIKRVLEAVYGPALPHNFYTLFEAVIGGGTKSCYHDNLQIK